jgi:hypothetical protein
MFKGAFSLFAVAVLLAVPAGAARQAHQSASGDTGDFQRDVDLYPDALLAAKRVMFEAGTDSNPHLYTTDLGARASGDGHRAQEILEILRKSMEKYKDYRVAIADGYQPFMPKTEQHLYWFINDRNAYASAFEFNPGHPTSLLYKKSRAGYELQGALFTAPKSATGLQLNDRVPLSVARWHEHVNLCAPPKHSAPQAADAKNFGLTGAISTHDACAAAGGRWVPQVFGWMVTVFPFESDPAKIWPQ